MAKATALHNPSYSLDLTGPEAETLRAILERIGGNPDHSRRQYADSIRVALDSVGVPKDTDDIHSTQRAIYFLDKK